MWELQIEEVFQSPATATQNEYGKYLVIFQGEKLMLGDSHKLS